MDVKEKKLLFEYVKLHQPVWEITEWHGEGRRGLYKFWAYPNSTWLDNMEEKGPIVLRYDYINWKTDSRAPWEIVQKIVDRHRAGKVLDNLAEGITRTVPDIIWSC